MKSERVTLLTTPAFKSHLMREAKREGVSVAEWVRLRCSQARPAAALGGATESVSAHDAALLSTLAQELSSAVQDAKRAMTEGLREAESVLVSLRATKPPGASARVAKRRVRA
jgi:hypothetical protein